MSITHIAAHQGCAMSAATPVSAPAVDEYAALRKWSAAALKAKGLPWPNYEEAQAMQAMRLACDPATIASLLAAADRVKELAFALSDAARSLEAISKKAGRDELMEEWPQVRGYADSRSRAAFKALRAAIDRASGAST